MKQVYVGKNPSVTRDFEIIAHDVESDEILRQIESHAMHKLSLPALKVPVIGMLPGRVAGFARVFFKRIPVVDAAGRASVFCHYVLVDDEFWSRAGKNPAFILQPKIFIESREFGPTLTISRRTGHNPRDYGDEDHRFSDYSAITGKLKRRPRTQRLVQELAASLEQADRATVHSIQSTTTSGILLAQAIMLLQDATSQDDFWFVASVEIPSDRNVAQFGFAANRDFLQPAQNTTLQTWDEKNCIKPPVGIRTRAEFTTFRNSPGKVLAGYELRANDSASNSPYAQQTPNVSATTQQLLQEILKIPLTLLLVGYTGAGKTTSILALTRFASLLPSGRTYIAAQGTCKSQIDDLAASFNNDGRTAETVLNSSNLTLTHTIGNVSYAIHIDDYRGGRIEETSEENEELAKLRNSYGQVDGVFVFYNANWVLHDRDQIVKDVYQNFVATLRKMERDSIPTALVLTHSDQVIPNWTGSRFVDGTLNVLRLLPGIAVTTLIEWPVVALAAMGTAGWMARHGDPNFQLMAGVCVPLFLYAWYRARSRYRLATAPRSSLWTMLFYPLRLIAQSVRMRPDQVKRSVLKRCRDIVNMHVNLESQEHGLFTVSVPTSPPASAGSPRYQPLEHSLSRSHGVTNPIDHCLFWAIAGRLRDYFARTSDVQFDVTVAHDVLSTLHQRFEQDRNSFQKYGCRDDKHLSALNVDAAYQMIEATYRQYDDRNQQLQEWKAVGRKILNEFELATRSDDSAWNDIQTHIGEYQALCEACACYPHLKKDLWAFYSEFITGVSRMEIRREIIKTLDNILEEDEFHRSLTEQLSKSIKRLESRVVTWIRSQEKQIGLEAIVRMLNLIEDDYLHELGPRIDRLYKMCQQRKEFHDSVNLENVIEFAELVSTLPSGLVLRDAETANRGGMARTIDDMARALIQSFMRAHYLNRCLVGSINSHDKKLDYAVQKMRGYLDRIKSLLNEINLDYQNVFTRKRLPVVASWLNAIHTFFQTELVEQLDSELEPLGNYVCACLAGVKSDELSSDLQFKLSQLCRKLDLFDTNRIDVFAENEVFTDLKRATTYIRDAISDQTRKALKSEFRARVRWWFWQRIVGGNVRAIGIIAVVLVFAFIGILEFVIGVPILDRVIAFADSWNN